MVTKIHHKYFEIQSQDPKLKQYFTELELKDISLSARSNKTTTYIQYMKLHDKNMTELLKEAKTEQKADIDMEDRQINNRLNNFILHLKEKKNKNSSIQTKMRDIRAFYNYYYVDLPRDNTPKKDSKEPALLTMEYIRKAIDKANLMYKSVISHMVSSGMDMSTTCSLNYGDFINAISDEIRIKDQFDIGEITEKVTAKKDLIASWDFNRVKRGIEGHTFSTYESLLRICDHLQERDRENTFPKTLEDPLFLNRGIRLIPNTGTKYFELLNDELGFGKVNGHRVFLPHQLRRFFTNVLHGHNIGEIKINWMLSHKINETDKAYFKANANQDKLKEEYRACLEDLYINEPVYIDKTNEKIQELEKKLKAKDEQIKTLEQENKAKIEEFNAKLGSISEEMEEKFRKLEEKTKNMSQSDNMKIAKQLSENGDMQEALYAAVGIDINALEHLVDKGIDPDKLKDWVQNGINLKDAEFLINEGVELKKVESFLIKDK